MSFRAQSRNPLEADKGNSVYSEEILRYTQDDKENGNNKSVILNEVKNLSVSTTNECRTGLEILRYTQDDRENKENNGHTF